MPLNKGKSLFYDHRERLAYAHFTTNIDCLSCHATLLSMYTYTAHEGREYNGNDLDVGHE